MHALLELPWPAILLMAAFLVIALIVLVPLAHALVMQLRRPVGSVKPADDDQHEPWA